ncbi:MAG: ATP-binding protein [Myxococcales bacterium]|nr:ATP-binding protein [Myxococcales bacterium]
MYATENSKILIVDDNPAIHEDFRKVLAPKNQTNRELDRIAAELFGHESESEPSVSFELDSAYQGKDGLALVEQAVEAGQPYALAFVDVRMPPGWDGIETVSRLWEVDSALEVVICSAYSDYPWSQIASQFGRTDRLLILKKPFDGIEVVQLAHALTRKWALQRAVQIRAEQLEALVQERTLELQASNDRLAQEMHEREKMEAELRLAQKLESVGQLAAGIAHEINTPMQYISDNTHFLKDSFDALIEVVQAYQPVIDAADGSDSELVRYARGEADSASLDYLRENVPNALDMTLEGINNVSRIVQAMKNFSHAGSDELVPTDLNAALEAAVTISRNEWKYVADVEIDCDESLPMVPSLGAEIHQVFLNIIINAAHAVGDVGRVNGGKKGTVRVASRVVGPYAEISIGDSGTGIPEAVRDKVFDPFFTTKEVGKGTGQGLSIARSVVVDRHAGQLDFESESGKGTTFFIRLPLERHASSEDHGR